MINIKPNNTDYHKRFTASKRRHIVMITNHGIHQWKVIPGLVDTGGQNVFVNAMTGALADQGFKVTIVNRGGYPHPETGKKREGLDYKNENERILFLTDGKNEFVRKEDMNDRIPQLAENLANFFRAEQLEIDALISHYWDAGKIGYMVKNQLKLDVPYTWIPHSLGAFKKRQVDKSSWEDLRIDERIEEEHRILREVDHAGYTSFDLKDSLENDYGYKTELFLPPCVDTKRFHPRELHGEEGIWNFLGSKSGLSAEEIRQRKIITEISRTDATKRKDVLVKAFAETAADHPEALLIFALDESRKDIAGNIHQLIEENGIEDSVITVGSVADELPFIYAASSVYCTPSVMEGFGMSAQEAAATEVPVVASSLVPYASEYLLGDSPGELPGDPKGGIQKGSGAIVVPADDAEGFSAGMSYLLEHEAERRTMAEQAYEITIPYFTWHRMIRDFLKALGLSGGVK